ncbi:MAG: AF1514 family protein [Thermodesulfobacteriota bacterium]|nr:AF1514 family protein [Thermodesulfobacteriota bacterium]
MTQETTKTDGPACTQPDSDLSGVTIVELNPEAPLKDYLEATELAKEEALKHMDDFMLMSWYDRDRDFESPQHATESDDPSGVPGYVYYALNHEASLKVDVEKGRFVFFFTPVEF